MHELLKDLASQVARQQKAADMSSTIHTSGQIIATSHDLTPHGRVVGEPCLKWPYFREIQVGEIL